jgi:hypothetical protein
MRSVVLLLRHRRGHREGGAAKCYRLTPLHHHLLLWWLRNRLTLLLLEDIRGYHCHCDGLSPLARSHPWRHLARLGVRKRLRPDTD